MTPELFRHISLASPEGRLIFALACVSLVSNSP
jgi:hypothetical protein